ncbi:hypothetical protein C8Q77DRAFT_1074463 [Trametes polyzona]|nr:hypothetical protein C8Q77DRAFT_1074463 [Trametes polyzona]
MVSAPQGEAGTQPSQADGHRGAHHGQPERRWNKADNDSAPGPPPGGPPSSPDPPSEAPSSPPPRRRRARPPDVHEDAAAPARDGRAKRAAKAFGTGLFAIVAVPVAVAGVGVVGAGTAVWGAAKVLEGIGRGLAAGPEAVAEWGARQYASDGNGGAGHEDEIGAEGEEEEGGRGE